MSMTCEQFIDTLGEFLEATLEANLRQHVAGHAEECPECRDYLETYRSTIDLLKQSFCGDDRSAIDADVAEQLVAAVMKARGAGR